MSEGGAKPGPSGSLSPFGARTQGRAYVIPLGVGFSLALHAMAATAIYARQILPPPPPAWVEMSVAAPPAPPPPPPPPPPETPKAKPKSVKFKDIVPVPVPPTPTPDPQTMKPVRRVVQGLNATSFATGSGTGLTVRAGNSTTVAAAGAGLGLDEATGPRTFASVTTTPSCNKRPMMEVPKEAQEANVEGEIKVAFDVGSDGAIGNVHVLRDLGHGTGEACAAAWRKVRCSPGQQNGTPVPVTGVPQVCTVRIEP